MPEDSVRLPVADAGFSYYIGQPVEVLVADREVWEPATITSTFHATHHGSEAMYKCMLLRRTGSMESASEERLRLPELQPPCNFHTNQLVEMQQPGGTWALARVMDITVGVGVEPTYLCKPIVL